MHNLVFVQITKRQYDLSSDVPDCCLGEPLDLVQVVINITARHVLEEEVNSEVVLKNILHRVNKRMLGLEEDFFFDFYVFDLILFNYDVLVEALHRIHLFRVVVLD